MSPQTTLMSQLVNKLRSFLRTHFCYSSLVECCQCCTFFFLSLFFRMILQGGSMMSFMTSLYLHGCISSADIRSISCTSLLRHCPSRRSTFLACIHTVHGKSFLNDYPSCDSVLGNSFRLGFVVPSSLALHQVCCQIYIFRTCGA